MSGEIFQKPPLSLAIKLMPHFLTPWSSYEGGICSSTRDELRGMGGERREACIQAAGAWSRCKRVLQKRRCCREKRAISRDERSLVKRDTLICLYKSVEFVKSSDLRHRVFFLSPQTPPQTTPSKKCPGKSTSKVPALNQF